MYIWLKKGAEERLATLKEQGVVGEVRIEIHRNSGKKYLSLYEDPFNPTADLPEIPEELIEKVTLQDRIYRGFRFEGIYRHEGATLLIKTRVNCEKVYTRDSEYAYREEWQDISASAPSAEELKAIYTLVRQGKISPDENWEDNAQPALPVIAPPEQIEETKEETEKVAP